MTHLRRLTTLAQLANAAAFLASDQASAMTGTVANLSGGAMGHPRRSRHRNLTRKSGTFSRAAGKMRLVTGPECGLENSMTIGKGKTASSR